MNRLSANVSVLDQTNRKPQTIASCGQGEEFDVIWFSTKAQHNQRKNKMWRLLKAKRTENGYYHYAYIVKQTLKLSQ